MADTGPRSALPLLNGALDPRVFKLNLIPYNPTGEFEGCNPAAIHAFRSALEREWVRFCKRVA